MNRLILGLIFMAVALTGCASNYYNVPTENIAEKVKVLGIAPILIDTDSDIIHPQKELLIPLVAELNRKYEPLLVSKLRNDENFFAVNLLTDEPQQLFKSLMARREKRDDADIQYNKYFFNNSGISSYIQKNRLDAVMLIVVSGLTRTSKLYSSNWLTTLETNFNFLTLSAQILGPDGTVLWEYPNFRGRLLTFYPLINLQYPDFSESEANLSKKTEVRFKSLDGIRRTLEKKRSDWLLRETPEPEAYGRLFDEIASVLAYSKKSTSGAGGGKTAKPENTGVKPFDPSAGPAPAQPATARSPLVPAPVTDAAVPTPIQPTVSQPSAHKGVAAPDVPAADPNEIVPATGSTL
jgi:hypothetical protein